MKKRWQLFFWTLIPLVSLAILLATVGPKVTIIIVASGIVVFLALCVAAVRLLIKSLYGEEDDAEAELNVLYGGTESAGPALVAKK